MIIVMLLWRCCAGLKTIIISTSKDLRAVTKIAMKNADFIVVNVAILAGTGTKTNPNYLTNLKQMSAYALTPVKTPLTGSGIKAPDSIIGTWVPGMAADPYKGTKGKQTARDASAYFTAQYRNGIQQLRTRAFSDGQKGVPLEWYRFERVVMDECHEATCPEDDACERNLTGNTGKDTRKGPLAARELMGVASESGDRPLRARLAVWGLTGTPMLTSVSRTTEMASLCGGTYLQGAAKHYRRMERVSRRDVIVDAISTTFSSPHYRSVQRAHNQSFIDHAVQRNRSAEFKMMEKTTNMIMAPLTAETRKALKAIGEGVIEAKTGVSLLAPEYKAVKHLGHIWESYVDVTTAAPERNAELRKLLEALHAANARSVSCNITVIVLRIEPHLPSLNS